MTAPAIVPEVVVPAESLTVTPPPAAMLSQAEATAQFIEKYRTQQASEAAGGERESETVVPAVDAPEVQVTPEGETPPPEGEKPAEVEGEKPPESQFRNADG